ncbi:uncharacterized protein GIQ15_06523 [Arthroderma uncinatum]|uniref:uncharacterized protein n=1 Tax=Arthroderma uncinatum TaxID=74035 RepID=UPI00144A5847|nr:uncharacterized protein GIQ15_06523 [Arthroderma uncinatum]KAF3479547.1 hypothetical protein GIQ15_06523 [Arthroderma uncinatum]
MCFGCVPYRALVIEDDPKEPPKKTRQWYMVRPGDGFYPVNYYEYGTIDPSRSRYSTCQHNEPTVYTYVPPQMQQSVHVGAGHPSGPPPPPAPAPILPGGPPNGGNPPPSRQPQAGQAIQVPYASPVPLRTGYQVPAGTVPWIGPTRAEVDAQNLAVARATGAMRPQSMVPYRPAEGQQWWCREIDGSYSLRTTNDIMENLQPGYWAYASSGYPYFIRQVAAA